MTTPTMRPAVLDLTTDDERPLVKIDKVDYELRVVNDFSVMEFRQIDRLIPQIMALAAKLEDQGAEVSDEDCVQLTAQLNALIRLVLRAPDDVTGKLGEIEKLLIFKTFLELLPPGLQRARALMMGSPMAAAPTAAN